MWKAKNPEISVIIPIYNVEPYLGECLESVIELTKKANTEVILIDDGSTDNSRSIAAGYAEKNDSIRLYCTENRGQGAARNYGVSRAKGRYLCFVDSDDMIIPDTYVEMMRAADHNNADFCVCRHLRIKDGTAMVSDLCNKSFYNLTTPVSDYHLHSRFVFDVLSWDKLIRRSFYDKCKIRFPEHCVYEDYPVSLKMYLMAKTISVCWKTGYLWRIRTAGDRSTTQEPVKKKTVDDKFRMLGKCIEIARDCNADSQFKKELYKKLVYDGLNSVLFLPKQFREEDYDIPGLFQKITQFVDPIISREMLDSMPALYENLYTGMKHGDVERVLRCVNYYKTGYNNAALVYQDSGVTLKAPDGLYAKSEYDAANEFLNIQPTVQVTELSYEGSIAHFYGHVFRKRVQTSQEYPQIVKSIIVDSRTNKAITIAAGTVKTPNITSAYGEMIDYEEYKTHHYCYDDAGFHFSIDLDKIDADDELSGDLPMLLYHRTVVDEGIQIMTGPTAPVKSNLNQKFRGKQSEISVVIDRSGAFFLRKQSLKP